MDIQDLQKRYAASALTTELTKLIGKKTVKTIFAEGLLASSAPMVFSAVRTSVPLLFVLQDADEAGYFYHDLCQIMGTDDVLFFPSSYRRAIKYAQKDPASEILRTEVLTRLTSQSSPLNSQLYVVTHPEALAEMVVTRQNLDSRTLTLTQGQTVDLEQTMQTMRELGFHEVDYVYEPGQFALRGSILDIFSFSHEYPFRIDFFGDDIDSIRTFEVEDQLSRERRDRADIVPEMSTQVQKESLFRFLPRETVLVFKDYLYAREAVERTYQEGFSTQALTERMEGATEVEQREIMREMQRDAQIITGTQFAADSADFRRIEFGHRPSSTPQASLSFHISPQPLFHKNFDLLGQTFGDYALKGYQLCVLADSQKQIERLREIMHETQFEGVNKTLHEGLRWRGR